MLCGLSHLPHLTHTRTTHSHTPFHSHTPLHSHTLAFTHSLPSTRYTHPQAGLLMLAWAKLFHAAVTKKEFSTYLHLSHSQSTPLTPTSLWFPYLECGERGGGGQLDSCSAFNMNKLSALFVKEFVFISFHFMFVFALLIFAEHIKH